MFLRVCFFGGIMNVTFLVLLLDPVFKLDFRRLNKKNRLLSG